MTRPHGETASVESELAKRILVLCASHVLPRSPHDPWPLRVEESECSRGLLPGKAGRLFRVQNSALFRTLAAEMQARAARLCPTHAVWQDAEMFSQNMSNCQELFRVWKDEALEGHMLKLELVSEAKKVGQFRQLVREQLKKRRCLSEFGSHKEPGQLLWLFLQGGNERPTVKINCILPAETPN